MWLAGRDFVAGDQVSIADLLMCCELQMLELLGGALEVSGRLGLRVYAP